MTDNALGGRVDGRQPDEMRPVRFTRDYTSFAAGSVLVSMGRTVVLCTASVGEDIPRWLKGSGRGWVTAEYSMLPGSSPQRVDREAARGRQSGRTQEIQRLIGRSLRAVTNLELMPDTLITLDCDVLQADGGTRTASVCGAYVALHDACTRLMAAGRLADQPLTAPCAAVSVGVVAGQEMLDLAYAEDSQAETDMNVVMAGPDRYIEIQGTAERMTFDRSQLDRLLGLAATGTAALFAAQSEVLSEPPPARGT
jgi:ribonuclease PH